MAEPSERDREMARNLLSALDGNQFPISTVARTIAAVRAEGVAQERAAWKEWAEETIKGTAEGQRIAHAYGRREAIEAAIEAVRQCASVDENGYLCEKGAAIKAIHALARPL